MLCKSLACDIRGFSDFSLHLQMGLMGCGKKNSIYLQGRIGKMPSKRNNVQEILMCKKYVL
jgi:hypothetical protein